ncbi:MAG: DegT/DnrJ/EryC1/StrS aminotransferase family protein [Chloroflexi bacterium]|nr:DegT/DnrJ/EryC1/StrS aminotransferase family protein [Chloroflexota bacterium]
MREGRFEVGSEFDWSDDWPTEGDPLPWPDDAPIFATGRGIIAALAPPEGARPRLHLPSYFCHDVAVGASAQFDLALYRHLPGRGGPDLDTLTTRPGDWVLAANLFGAEDGAAWVSWRRNRDVILIEDHTHDPLSAWARGTAADYAFASLRKTLPIPDGAVLWSPAGLGLPPAGDPAAGATAKLEAMLLKRAYLRGAPIPRDSYRALQIAGERQFETDRGGRASVLATELLHRVRPWAWRTRRKRNVRHFLRRLEADPPAGIAPLFATWPAGGAPFAAILVCADGALRESLRRFLIKRSIFAAVHWPIPAGSDPLDTEAGELSSRLLTVPLDQRYGPEDVDRMVETVLAHGDRTV